MTRILRILAACALCAVAACGDSDSSVKVIVFQATPDAIESGQSTTLVFAVEPSNAKVQISDIGDVTGQTSVKVSPGTTTTYQLTATSGDATQTQSTTVTVGATSAAAIRIEPGTATPVAGASLPVTLTVLASDGKPAPGFRGTVHLTSTDAKAALPGDLAFTADDKGQKAVTITLQTAGLSTLTATDTSAKAGVQGAASVTVLAAAAKSYQVSALPATASAGQSLVLTITVKDTYGNTVTGYAGQAQVTSTDATDLLPASGGFSDGVRTVNLAFTKSGNHTAQIVDAGAALPSTTTTSVAVTAAAPTRIAVATASTDTTAGTSVSLSAQVLDGFDNVCTGYTGTVHFAATDASATVPADFTFSASDAGRRDFGVTLKTAGGAAVTISDTAAPTVAGTASWTVRPAAASAFALGALPASATAGQSLVLTIIVKDAFGNVVTDYAGQARLTSTDLTDVLPSAGGFTAGVRTVSLAFTKTGAHTATVADVAGTVASAATTSVVIAAGPAVRIAVTTANTATTAGAVESLTARVLDLYDNVCTGYTGSVHFAATDASATLPADFTFTAADLGSHDFGVTLKTAGITRVTVGDTAAPAVNGAASWTVQSAAAATYVLTALPATATAGQSLVLTITVKDSFGNVATSYAGQARLTSTDATDVLPASGAFTAGVRTVSLAFTKAGAHTATVADVAGLVAPGTTSSVAISAGPAFRVAVTAGTTTTAGTAEALTARIVDFYDNTVVGYTGTLHFTSDDTKAQLPADFTFGAGDSGSHGFSVTLKTTGRINVAISDTAAPGVSGTASWMVGSAAATTCVASQAPTTAPAGSVIGLTVAVRDTFGNPATGYAGTVRVTASDARASLPADVTYAPASDAGSHAFSVQLLSTGNQTVTATDTANAAIQCALVVSITAAAPKLVLTVPASANAGYPVQVGVAVKDVFDNAIPAFAGQVTFTSSDAGTGAAKPSTITFTGSEGGVATASATFVTVGAQTLSATTTGSPAATASATAQVHGLVYTAPSSGRVRLVANTAASTSQVVQLDLVANERLEVSTFFGGGPGSFAAGMNLPLDTTRVGADTTLFIPGSALTAGTGTRAAVGRLGADHVLYTAVSRKRVAGSVFAQENEVLSGQVFYSVRLKLTQTGTVGPVFDGAQLVATYRAAVRDQFGDDFVSQADFGVGKLEIR